MIPVERLTLSGALLGDTLGLYLVDQNGRIAAACTGRDIPLGTWTSPVHDTPDTPTPLDAWIADPASPLWRSLKGTIGQADAASALYPPLMRFLETQVVAQYDGGTLEVQDGHFVVSARSATRRVHATQSAAPRPRTRNTRVDVWI